MTVRVATRRDEPELLRLLHLMHAEGGLLPLDVECAREMFARAFDRKGGIIGVIGNKKIEAALFLLITRNWYTKFNHIEELFNYVDPDHRRSTHAREMITFADRCSKEIGVPLFIGVLTNKRLAAKVRLYSQILGPPVGAYFVRNCKWDAAVEPAKEDFLKATETRAQRRHRERRTRKSASKKKRAA